MPPVEIVAESARRSRESWAGGRWGRFAKNHLNPFSVKVGEAHA
jgi:hypothetical protein